MIMNNRVSFSQLGNIGRLGNQFFQIAFTIAYAIRTNMDFHFPKWVYSKWMNKELPFGDFDKADVNSLVSFHYEPISLYPGKNVDLRDSHGQTEKYFKNQWEVIKPYLTIKDEYKEAIKYKYRGHLGHQKTCSIHIRLTDYTNPVNIDYHGMCSMDYYRKAIAEIYGDENPKDVLFMIFSDEISKAKEMFSLPNMYFVEPDDSIVPKMKELSGLSIGNGDLMELFLMSYCKDNIIVNSSFSWWGAWLNENPNKRVVAPLHWFNQAPIDYKDVVPEGWIKIDNRNLPK